MIQYKTRRTAIFTADNIRTTWNRLHFKLINKSIVTDGKHFQRKNIIFG